MTVNEIEKCINEYGNDIYRFCRHLTGNTDSANDLYQDCFLAAMQKNDFPLIDNQKSYLISIAANLWKNKWRKQKRRQEIAAMVEYNADYISDECLLNQVKTNDILEVYVATETQKMLIQLVSQLPDKYKLIIIMYYGEDMSTAEISKALHISKGTVTSRLARARKIIKDSLEELGYEG